MKKGLLIRLRRGWFTFAEYREKPDYIFYFANRMYKPSYISLHTALAFYGLIPEAVIQITSVSSLKTNEFVNEIGAFIYRSLFDGLFFGYEPRPVSGGKTIYLATPEKALLDLLYLYPEYKTVQHMEDLRLDEDLLHERIDTGKLFAFSVAFRNKALEKRLSLLRKTYEL